MPTAFLNNFWRYSLTIRSQNKEFSNIITLDFLIDFVAGKQNNFSLEVKYGYNKDFLPQQPQLVRKDSVFRRLERF